MIMNTDKVNMIIIIITVWLYMTHYSKFTMTEKTEHQTLTFIKTFSTAKFQFIIIIII